PAPEAYETETDNGKVVEVSGPELDYTDILTYSEIPEEWSITSSKQIRVIWVEDNNPDLRKDWQFEAFDLNENGVIDYIEWNTPHLSNQTFEIIKIAKAVRLNSNRTFVEDVYDKVKAKDNIWQNIPDGEYLRVTFEKNLTNINDITIYARGSGSLGVYGQDSDYLITQFDNINSENWYKVYLTNLQGSQDVFDLKVLGNVDFDYVIDPYTDTGQLIQDVDDCGILNTANAVYTLTGNVKGNSTCFNITASNITLNCQGYMINFSANITGGGVGVFVDSENYTTIENCRIEGIGFSVLPLYAQAVVVHSSSNTSINNNTIIFGGSFSFVDSLFINPAYGDVYFPSLSELNNAGTFNFTNTSNLENANLTILWDSDVYSTLNVRWYLDLVVNSSSSRLENVNVSLRDRNQVLKFSSLTNSSGEIGRKILTEFVQTASSTKTYYSLYNLTAGKSGYTSYENHTINMTKNVNLNIVLSSVVDNSIVTDCKELNIENQIYNLQNDVSSSGVCFNITANNITMNCNNSQITYGTGGIESYAFYSVDASNITIKNCNIIEDVNSANYNYAIYFINTTSSSIYNNTITTMYDSSDAIHMTKTTIQANITGNNLEVDGNDVNAIYLAGNSGKKDSTNNTIYKNDIIATYYPGSGSAGIYFSEVSNTTVESNIINMSAPTYGAYIYNSVSNSFLYNVIYGMDYVQGFEIAGSNSRFNKFIGNNFSSFGISTNGIYISADLGSNLIENNTIVSSAEGIYLLNTKANSINRNNITTLGDTYASGIYIGSSGDSSFIGNIILTNGTDAPGILDRGDNKNITIQDCVITTLGNSSYAIRFNDFSSFATGIEVIDTILNASFEYMQELDINSIASGGIWNFTNVTLPDLTNFETNWEAGAIGNLNLKWWVEVNVSNSVTYTQIDGAGVNITNVFGSKQYSQATNATGRTPKSSLREYMRNETNTYYDSLYTLAAEKSGYSAYSNSSINTTTNMWINVLMTEGASDTTLPLVQLVYPTNVSYNINVSSLNYSASDTNLQACWYSVTSGSINTTVDCGSNLTGLTSTEGSNAWLIGANDTSGNRNSSAVTFWKDTVLPVIYITNPKNKSYTDANLFFNLTLSENTSACLYQYDTSANVSMQRVNDTSFGARKTLITAAPHTVIFTCNDSLNNYNLTSISFTRDTTPPIIIINSPLNTTYESGSNILINITFGDDAQAKLVDYNGTNYTYTNIFYANLTNGTTRVIAFVNDSAGNQNTTIRNFVVTTSGIQEGGGDIDGPSITLQAPADGASTTSAAIDFQFDVTDDSNVDNCSLLFSDVAVQTTSSISKTATNTISRSLSAGSYSWKINCTDAIGNINGSSSRSLTISSSTGCSNCGGGGGCSSECTVGNLRCSGSVLQSCAKDYDSDSCYEWGGTLQTCSQGCSNGACINQNCTESWKCSDYGKCEVGLIKRNCTDDNNCGTKLYKPEETQVCTIGQLVLEYSPEILDLILPQGKEQKFSAIAIEQSEAGEIPIIARWYADNIKIQEEAGINSSLISLFKVSGSSKVKLEVFDTYNNQQVVWNIQYVNASGCREDWACDWSACDENGYSYPRSCYDKNNCGTNADYPRMKTCGREGSDISCRPTWKCSDWGECQVSYKMSDVVKNKIETAGEQSRTCQDESKCYSSTTEKRSCSLTRAVTVKNVEWCNEKYVEICDAETKQIVSRIRETGFDQESLKSVGLITGKVIKGVDIGLIVANFTGYCDYCYDDVKNYDETSVDCGGPNCPVCQEINLARDFSNWYRCWLWILFIILLIAYLIYLYKTSKHAKEKYHKKARESLMKKIKGFEDREMREWGLK
ncbi:MAG: right-handed parallel beta-helix repeat-containing protein, partial [Candidatus Pacearchaeota archaeon]|nr:right-handed parallel beta-helix repeat-containing protein [Candidatus Pacearchaeota archaeon]